MPAPLSDYSYLRTTAPASSTAKATTQPKPLTSADFEFMSRMDQDIDDRRRTAFITELSAQRSRTAQPGPPSAEGLPSCSTCRTVIARAPATAARAAFRPMLVRAACGVSVRRKGPTLPSIDAGATKVKVQDGHARGRPDHQDHKEQQDRARASGTIQVGAAGWMVLRFHANRPAATEVPHCMREGQVRGSRRAR